MVQKVVVVNGNPRVMEMLDNLLEQGHYDMVFVESSDRAYSQVRKVLPDLVITCSTPDDMDTCQLLTMLKLDPDTCTIPVLTYAMEAAGPDFDVNLPPIADDIPPFVQPRAASAMN